MRLAKMKICNFRSFENEITIEIDDLNGFIGANSSGKTSALLALSKIFSENSSERMISKNDFFQSKIDSGETVSERKMYIEAVFKAEIDANETPLYFNSYVVDSQEGNPYLRIRLEANWIEDGTLEGAIDSQVYFITCPENDEITENDKKNANRNVLNKIRVIYIPAIRNPNLQLKNASGSILHRIMKSINWQDGTRTTIEGLIGELNKATTEEKGVALLKNAISEEWKNYQSDSRYSEATLIFNSDHIEGLLTKAEVVFSSEKSVRKSSIDEMGDGLRSLFYISIIESLLDIEEKILNEEKGGNDKSIDLSSPILTIVAVEEPENHIAPHLLGKLISQLRSVSKKGNAQVLLTSHSPAIIKRIQPEEIRFFRLDINSNSTTVKNITLPEGEKISEQYKFVKEAVRSYPELYFSKLVILGEGDSEELILSKFFELDAGNIDVSEISIVPLSGRFVNHFWRLLSDLEIHYITLLDLDRERNGGGWGRIKYALKQLIDVGSNKDKILVLEDGKVLSNSELEKMHKWSTDGVLNMNAWMARLESYGVFYSSPLDIDFLMLEKYEENYKSILSANEGPIVKTNNTQEKVKDIEFLPFPMSEYSEKKKSAVRSALKEYGGNGATYTENQKRLMVWYNYFFLGRGKPTTHISMFSKISDSDLKAATPEVISKIIKRANLLLNGGNADD